MSCNAPKSCCAPHLMPGGPATLASTSFPTSLAGDGAGGLFVVERNGNAVRRVWANGTVTTAVGASGVAGTAGDGGAGVLAKLSGPNGAALDTGPNGGLFVAVRIE